MTLGRREFLCAGGILVPAAWQPGVASGNRLTLASPGAGLMLSYEKNGAARLESLQNRSSGFEWCQAGQPIEPVLTAGAADLGKWLAAGGSSAGQVFTLDYSCARGVAAHTGCRAFPESPVFEYECGFRNTGSQPIAGVTAFGPFRIALRPGLGPLQVHAMRRNTYAIERIPVEGALELGGGDWNSPEHAGLLLLEAIEAREYLFAIIECERGWRYRLEHKRDATWLTVEVAGLSYDLAAGGKLACPRVSLGVAAGDLNTAVNAAQRHLKRRMFPEPLPNSPWVVYDFWATEDDGVQPALLRELEFAAGLGVELFYIDAAWYKGSSKRGNGDWGSGLGNYEDDREKYPLGLRGISDRVHQAGLKFGLWVGPNIVDSRLVPEPIPRRWIAQLDGADRVLRIPSWEAPCLQMCLGCVEYIEHLKKNLHRIVDEFRLDWLKWDNSGIPGVPGHCNRADHGHQRGDGSYAALLGEYEVFDHLHNSFPNLVLEQCGYGSRLDYGLARTIRANWLSDATFPTDPVRRNALVAGFVYPTFYNGAWVVKEDPDLKKTDPATLDTLYRSRMTGLFGFGTLNGQLAERVSLFPAEVLAAARRNISLYKRYRHLLHEDTYWLFPPGGSPERWQAIEFARRDGAQAVILCFRNHSTQARMRIPVRGLNGAEDYAITAANSGAVSRASGKQLLRGGLIASLDTPEASEVFLVEKAR